MAKPKQPAVQVDDEVLQHEVYYTGEGWLGQAVLINKTKLTCSIVFTTPHLYDDDEEELAHAAVRKWARDNGFLIKRAMDADPNDLPLKGD